MDEIYCEHLRIEDTYNRDIYGHPKCKYYCAKKDKEVLYLMCVRCKDNTMKSDDNR